MLQLGIAIYAACVDFLINGARLLHITYRDTNAILFFVVWPIVTIVLIAIVIGQGVMLRRRRRDRA
jgi:hypothetical protein